MYVCVGRCNVAVMLLCDVVLDGVELDWSIHVPLMLHIVFLAMDHTRYSMEVCEALTSTPPDKFAIKISFKYFV